MNHELSIDEIVQRLSMYKMTSVSEATGIDLNKLYGLMQGTQPEIIASLRNFLQNNNPA